MKTEIEQAIHDENWGHAQRLLLDELQQAPGNHWLLTRLATTSYEQGDYESAHRYVAKAMKLAPHCPLVLWDFACIEDMRGNEKAAISAWKTLINRGVEAVAHEECGEGVRWAKSLINDCRYRVGVAYAYLGQPSNARNYLRKHLEHRKRGLPSLYEKSEIKSELAALK